MKICVLMKQVASEDSPLSINNNSIDKSSLNLVTNEPDSYALEEALLIKEKTNGEVVICTLGPEYSQQVIKDGWLSFYPGAKIGVLGQNGAG